MSALDWEGVPLNMRKRSGMPGSAFREGGSLWGGVDRKAQPQWTYTHGSGCSRPSRSCPAETLLASSNSRALFFLHLEYLPSWKNSTQPPGPPTPEVIPSGKLPTPGSHCPCCPTVAGGIAFLSAFLREPLCLQNQQWSC